MLKIIYELQNVKKELKFKIISNFLKRNSKKLQNAKKNLK